jgi:uncharacterized oxidoreductase
MAEVVISADALTAVVSSIVEAGGSDAREASLVAGNLVAANLAGHDSHGVGMLPRYIEVLKEGDLKVNAHPQVLLDTGPLLRVDGLTGYGQVIGKETMDMAIDRAAKFGVCLVSIVNSHHLGRIGHWAEQCLEAGMVSIHFVNVLPRPIVAPYAGKSARFSTNPMCVGIPLEGQPPFLLDFATSRVAHGKVRVAYNKGETLKENTIIDAEGNPTTDPARMIVEPLGALLPFGEHKGYGLAMACEMLAGAVTGAETLHGTHPRRQIINNMLSIVIDPRIYGTASTASEQAAAFVDWVKSSPVRDGMEMMIAGDPERSSRAKRSTEGIPVDVNTWQEIRDAGEKVGVNIPGAGVPAAT